MLKLLIKLCTATIVGAAIAPFIVTTPDGQPLLTLEALKQIIQHPEQATTHNQWHLTLQQLQQIYQLKQDANTAFTQLQHTVTEAEHQPISNIDFKRLAELSKKMTPPQSEQDGSPENIQHEAQPRTQQEQPR